MKQAVAGRHLGFRTVADVISKCTKNLGNSYIGSRLLGILYLQ